MPQPKTRSSTKWRNLPAEGELGDGVGSGAGVAGVGPGAELGDGVGPGAGVGSPACYQVQ